MIHCGRATVAAAGTKVALAATRTMASWVLCTSDPSNTDYVYVGDSNVRNLAAGPVGCPLTPGNWHIFREVTGIPYIDLKDIYIDSDDNGDSVSYIYGLN